MNKIPIILLLSIISTHIFSQPSPANYKNTGTEAAPVKGSVSGTVYEKGSNTPLEYSNVALFSVRDSSLAGGGITDAGGKFQVEGLMPGLYYMEAKFIGYERAIIQGIKITRESLKVNLGKIELVPATENISEVKVVGNNEKAVSYQIDRKVVDPSQFPTAANGTAVDILAQTPSVSVDIEGNVSLRGSQSFTVLIDGRPTPFDPADILQQIPASTIQSIEIITNPSAKYDPDGTAGIINIKTKKSKMEGISGIVNSTIDSYGSLTGDFLMNYRAGKFNFFLSGDRANRFGKDKNESNSMIITNDTTTTQSTGKGERGHSTYSIKTGFDYFMNERNTLSFNVSMNGRGHTEKSESTYSEYSSGVSSMSVTKEEGDRDGKDLALSLNYSKKFLREGHKLDLLAYYNFGNSDENNYYDQFDFNNNLIKGQNSWESGDDKGFRFQADYVLPVGKDSKIEAGYQARIDRENEWNDVLWYSTAKPQSPEADENSPYYRSTDFSRDIHSIYGIWNDKLGILGYQLGLRTEYTDRRMEYSATTDVYTINRWDFFPTVHFSAELPAKQQLIASYTRRINRPRGFFLEPFITYIDAYNIRKGDPSIEPEYIDSYELGYQKDLSKGFFSLEGYYRITHNMIERISSAWSENILLQTVANVGSDYSLGVEGMINTNPAKWWILNLMGNLYDYRMKGEAAGKKFDSQSFNWNSRLNNTFIITPTTKIQVSGMYNSPTTSAQGRREGFAFTNLAVRKDLFDNKLTATFSVMDLLHTAKFEFTSEGDDFYSHRKFQRESPVFSLTLSFKINNFKKESNKREEGGEGMMDFEGEM